MQIIDKIKAMFKDTKSPKHIDWIIFGIIAVFLYFCFIYWDIIVTTTHTTNYLEAFFHGRIFDLYKVNYGVSVMGIFTMVCYDIPIYFIFMIWDLPIWLLHHLFNVNIINNFFCLIWMKGIVVLFLGLSCLVLKKICQEIGLKKEHIKWIILIFVSSPLVFSSLFILCQYDIISIFFMLLGILGYVQEKQPKFLFWFAVAIPMKLFPLFIFIPLLLLKEKRIFHIIYKSLLVLNIFVIFRVIAIIMPYYMKSTSGFNLEMMRKLFEKSTLPINISSASLFTAAYIILCVLCYLKNIKDKKELHKYAIYVPFAVFVVFFMFVDFHPYWLIYLTPFFPILLFMNSKYFKINLLIEMAFSFVSLVIITYSFPFCFSSNLISGMLIDRFASRNLDMVKFYDLRTLYIEKMGNSPYLPALLGAFLAFSICMLVINLPKLNDKQEKIEVERSAILLRMLMIIPFAFLIIYCYFS